MCNIKEIIFGRPGIKGTINVTICLNTHKNDWLSHPRFENTADVSIAKIVGYIYRQQVFYTYRGYNSQHMTRLAVVCKSINTNT